MCLMAANFVLSIEGANSVPQNIVAGFDGSF